MHAAAARWIVLFCLAAAAPFAAAPASAARSDPGSLSVSVQQSVAPSASLLDQARDAARTDRNAESARLFESHIRAHPGERSALLREYADQLVYSGRPEAAVPLFGEVLARPGLDPDERRRAQHGLALALAWSDQQRGAIAAYRAILAEAPDDRSARIGLARSLHWLGRPDGASAALAVLAPPDRSSGEALQLGSDIARDAAPRTDLAFRLTGQSDDLEIASFRLDQHFHARSGTIRLSPFYERIRYRPERGSGALIDHPGLAVRARLSDSMELSGRAGIERRHIAGSDDSLFTYEAALALLPSDAWRFDLVAARRTFDNVRSIERAITADHLFVSADHWPDPLLRLTARGDRARFSDGNERRWGQLEVERRLSRRPNLFVGARATALGFSRQLDNGYFNPRHLVSAELTARGWGQIAPRTWLDLSGSSGLERSRPGGTSLVYSGRAKLSHALSDRVDLSLAAEAFSAALTGAGFSRHSLIAAIGWRW